MTFGLSDPSLPRTRNNIAQTVPMRASFHRTRRGLSRDGRFDPYLCIGFMIPRMRTGELAAHAGVNIQTVRFYERRGILPKPSRTASGYRVYSAEAVRLIRFIKRSQELGFTLDEIEDLLRLRNNRRSSCAVVKSAGQAKMAAVEAKIADLKAMKRALAVLLASCERNDRDRECPILEALERPSDEPLAPTS